MKVTSPVQSQAIPDGLLCLRCRYALRGFAADACCPECALPVAQSLARPGLTNAPVPVLKRLSYWSARLAWSSGLLGLLWAAVFFVIIRSLTFMFGAPAPLIIALMHILPPLILGVLIALAATATRSAAAMRDAGACSPWHVRLVLAGSVLLAVGWGMSIVEQYVDRTVFGFPLMSISIWAGGACYCIVWALTVGKAARTTGGAPRRALAMLELIVASTLMLAAGVVTVGIYVGFAYLPFAGSIYSISQDALPFLILASSLLTTINAVALSVSTRHLVAARLAAA